MTTVLNTPPPLLHWFYQRTKKHSAELMHVCVMRWVELQGRFFCVHCKIIWLIGKIKGILDCISLYLGPTESL